MLQLLFLKLLLLLLLLYQFSVFRRLLFDTSWNRGWRRKL